MKTVDFFLILINMTAVYNIFNILKLEIMHGMKIFFSCWLILKLKDVQLRKLIDKLHSS